jgi:hypothetical protein
MYLQTGRVLDLSDRPILNNTGGMPIAMHVIRFGQRVSMPQVGTHVAFSGTFNKLRSDTSIVAHSTVFGAGYWSGNCGVGMRLDNTWDHGVAYQYDGLYSQTFQTTIVIGTSRWTGFAAGTRTINWGWNRLGTSVDRPFIWINPNSSDDGRNQQMISSMIVYEVVE